MKGAWVGIAVIGIWASVAIAAFSPSLETPAMVAVSGFAFVATFFVVLFGVFTISEID